MGLLGTVIDEAAQQLANQSQTPPDPYRWMKRAIALAILVFGWMFIIWANRFHISAPTIFVCIAFLAIEVAVYNLFRTGAQVVADGEDGDSTWGRPLGAKGELEREKKTLLKAIKEAEFDREMGKLSRADADEMIGLYRARAIEVIKELDRLGATSVGTVREQIEREVKARLELEQRTKGVAEKAVEKQDNFKKKKGKGAKANAKAEAAAKPAADSKADAKSSSDAKSADPKTDDAKAADSESAPGVDLSATESSKTAAKEAAQ